jgi:hypothetical protein
MLVIFHVNMILQKKQIRLLLWEAFITSVAFVASI